MRLPAVLLIAFAPLDAEAQAGRVPRIGVIAGESPGKSVSVARLAVERTAGPHSLAEATHPPRQIAE